MKPLLIIELPYDASMEALEQMNEFAANAQKNGLEDYTILVIQGAKATPYYPCNFITYIFQKIKAWLILRTVKKSLY